MTVVRRDPQKQFLHFNLKKDLRYQRVDDYGAEGTVMFNDYGAEGTVMREVAAFTKKDATVTSARRNVAKQFLHYHRAGLPTQFLHDFLEQSLHYHRAS